MAKLDPALWRDMMDYLRHKHAPICRRWFDDLDPVKLDAGLLEINTLTTVQRNYLQQRCREQFTEAAQAATGALVSVRFINGVAVRDDQRGARRHRKATSPPSRHPAENVSRSSTGKSSMVSPHTSSLDKIDEFAPDLVQTVISPDYTFENFVTGPGNRLAHAAAVAVANQPGTAYNPLFIHGGVGLGKTHLLQAISQTILKSNPDSNLCYLSCDTFVNQFLDCVQKGQMNQFRNQYRHVDLLVIDDIHFLANRERTQEEFFHTFNALFQSSRQIVLSCDSPPVEIPQLEERLVSRFQSGMVALISKPTFETRVAIIRAKSALRGLHLPDDVISYIASKVDSNARELEGAMNTIQGHAALGHLPINLNLAKESLGEPTLGARRSQLTLQQIIDTVTSFYDVKLSSLQSKLRKKSIATPRQVCMYLARKRTHFSLEQIGGYFGGRDHTTVMHAIKTIDRRIGEDLRFARQVEQLEDQIMHPSSGSTDD